jgi:hypothetical protein
MAAWIGSVKLPRDRGMLRRAAQAAQASSGGRSSTPTWVNRRGAARGALQAGYHAGGGREGGSAGKERLRATLAILRCRVPRLRQGFH